MHGTAYTIDHDATALSLRRRIERVIEPILAFHSFVLVDMHQTRQRHSYQIRLMLHRGPDFSTSDLEHMHKILYPRLTVLLDDQHVSLELTSPGIDYAFRHDSDYEIFSGEMVRILTKSDNQWCSGKLMGKSDNHIRLQASDGTAHEYDVHNIIKATLHGGAQG